MATDKAKRAAEMVCSGKKLREVAEALGYASPSGVAMLLERYRRELPREALEQLQAKLLARLETVETMALEDAHDPDPLVRDRGQRRIIRAVEARARISGIVKAPPPFVVMNSAPQGTDLSMLSIDEIEFLKSVQAKMLQAPIEAHGEAVEDERSDEHGE